MEKNYPTHERLPALFLPEPLAAEMVQHRFRRLDGWPIIQLGPGILTINDTDKYKWENFQPECVEAINTLFSVHPSKGNLRSKSLVLRYIDAMDFDHTTQDIAAFLRIHMDVTCGLPGAIFSGSPVQPILPRVSLADFISLRGTCWDSDLAEPHHATNWKSPGI